MTRTISFCFFFLSFLVYVQAETCEKVCDSFSFQPFSDVQLDYNKAKEFCSERYGYLVFISTNLLITLAKKEIKSKISKLILFSNDFVLLLLRRFSKLQLKILLIDILLQLLIVKE